MRPFPEQLSCTSHLCPGDGCILWYRGIRNLQLHSLDVREMWVWGVVVCSVPASLLTRGSHGLDVLLLPWVAPENLAAEVPAPIHQHKTIKSKMLGGEGRSNSP